ncbi:MAG: hypothetical protein OSA48_12085, partial [Akkermansiaceae bacterium]|nr:hypothetical protein [Akkermansiaceae bacterium]
MGHDNGILATGEQKRRIFKLRRSFPQDENGLGLNLIEMTELVVGHWGKKVIGYWLSVIWEDPEALERCSRNVKSVSALCSMVNVSVLRISSASSGSSNPLSFPVN